jgi:hypothetical protein
MGFQQHEITGAFKSDWSLLPNQLRVLFKADRSEFARTQRLGRIQPLLKRQEIIPVGSKKSTEVNAPFLFFALVASSNFFACVRFGAFSFVPTNNSDDTFSA